jgi:hypothetical protein
MAVDLSDYAPTLRREVTPLGSALFESITDTQLTPYLTDAFWEARLDGFLTGYTADEDGIVEPTAAGGADLTPAGVALIVLYAGIKILRNRILNMNTGFRAKAGPVEFEQQNSATMLAEMLKQLRDRKNQLLDRAAHIGTDVVLLDAYSVRLLNPASYAGGPELTTGG